MRLTKQQWIHTLLLSGAATVVSVFVHHQKRCQTNPNARLKDYPTGVINQILSLIKSKNKSSGHHLPSPNDKPSFISGVATLYQNKQGVFEDGFGVVGLNDAYQIIWQTHLPTRLHDMIIGKHIIAMGRRPSETFWVLDKTGKIIKQVTSAPNRHYYGHGCISVDGLSLYVCENNTDTLQGCIGIYETKTYQKIGEFDGCGIGPHEIVCHPDGVHLVIAGGGIKTEKASRLELNLDTMTPALYYMNRHTGQVVANIPPNDPLMSIRHLAIRQDGLTIVGIQYQGDKDKTIPLLLTHTLGDDTLTAIELDNIHRLDQYIASVAVNNQHNLACIASPIGGHTLVVDLTTRQEVYSIRLADCAGVCAIETNSSGRFLVSDGTGRLTNLSQDKNGNWTADTVCHKVAFDNHLRAVRQMLH